MTDRFMYKLPPQVRTPPVLDRLGDNLSDMPNLRHGKLPPRAEGYDSIRSPEADMMDTVVHLQLDVETLKFVQSGPSTWLGRFCRTSQALTEHYGSLGQLMDYRHQFERTTQQEGDDRYS